MNPIIIVGSGLAGYSLAREIRKLDSKQPMMLISQDDAAVYSKPMLSNALSKNKTVAELITSDAQKQVKQLSIEIIPFTTVTKIDSSNKQIEIQSNTPEYSRLKRLTYDSLILAIGASQRRLPLISDDAQENVLSVNSLYDYAHFRERLEQVQNVGIIGPGLIGCEFANDLRTVDKKVTVIGPSERPIENLLPPMAAQFLKEKLKAEGVIWKLNNRVESLSKTTQGFVTRLTDGSELEFDLLLSAIGLQINTDLARSSGIKVEHGIIVDDFLQTSENDIYALGDCMQWRGIVMPYIMPIMHASRALAKTLTGSKTRVHFPVMPVVVKTPACPCVAVPVAHQAQGEWQCERNDMGLKALFFGADKRLLGFTLMGDRVSEKQSLSKQLNDTTA